MYNWCYRLCDCCWLVIPVALCLVHRKKENERLLTRAIGCCCCLSAFVTEDKHSVLGMFVLIRQSTNSSFNATAVISVDDHFVMCISFVIVIDLHRSENTSVCCWHLHGVKLWKCSCWFRSVSLSVCVCSPLISWQLQNRFSWNVIRSFIKVSPFFILLKIRQQLFALYLKTCICFCINFSDIYLREKKIVMKHSFVCSVHILYKCGSFQDN
jgi:hypothetical protein